MTFLTRHEVLALHARLIELYGGDPGLRDEGLFDSALAQPEASFDGQFLHADIFAMAAAYGFHLGQAQSLMDGNKRTATAAMLVFLELNGHPLHVDQAELYAAMIAVAERRLSKAALAQWLRDRAG